MLQNVSVNTTTVRSWATVLYVPLTLIQHGKLHFYAEVFGESWKSCNQKHHIVSKFLWFFAFSLSWHCFFTTLKCLSRGGFSLAILLASFLVICCKSNEYIKATDQQQSLHKHSKKSFLNVQYLAFLSLQSSTGEIIHLLDWSQESKS